MDIKIISGVASADQKVGTKSIFVRVWDISSVLSKKYLHVWGLGVKVSVPCPSVHPPGYATVKIPLEDPILEMVARLNDFHRRLVVVSKRLPLQIASSR